MTVPSAPLQQPGPAQWDWLIHFCGRPPGSKKNRFVPDMIARLNPWQRLDNILWEQRLNGYPPFGAGSDQPMICLSETPEDHLCWLLRDRRWPTWGLVFRRNDVYGQGGAPVWYARQKQYEPLNQDQYRWAVRFETDRKSDWLHEREWRIPVPPGDESIDLGDFHVEAILIADPDWQPSLRPVQMNVSALPRLWQSTPRFYWDSTTNELIPCGS